MNKQKFFKIKHLFALMTLTMAIVSQSNAMETYRIRGNIRRIDSDNHSFANANVTGGAFDIKDLSLWNNFLDGKDALIVVSGEFKGEWDNINTTLNTEVDSHLLPLREHMGKNIEFSSGKFSKFCDLRDAALKAACLQGLQHPLDSDINFWKTRIEIPVYDVLWDTLAKQAVFSYMHPKDGNFKRSVQKVCAHLMHSAQQACVYRFTERQNQLFTDLTQERTNLDQASANYTRAQANFVQEQRAKRLAEQELTQERNTHAQTRTLLDETRRNLEENRCNAVLAAATAREEAERKKEQHALERERNLEENRRNAILAAATAREEAEREKEQHALERERLQTLRAQESQKAARDYESVRSQLSPLRHRADELSPMRRRLEAAEVQTQEKDAAINLLKKQLEEARRMTWHPLQDDAVVKVSPNSKN
ncbi:hypothetical protein BH09DEP1_BH09DEP1_7080 [soil metagenome]